jgi:hypothetical protein
MPSRRRYEILLPIRYNDGTPVEPDKFFQTQEELGIGLCAHNVSLPCRWNGLHLAFSYAPAVTSQSKIGFHANEDAPWDQAVETGRGVLNLE